MPEETVSLGNVRLSGMTGLVQNAPRPPSLTHSRPRDRTSFEHLVRAAKERERHGQTERPGGLEV